MHNIVSPFFSQNKYVMAVGATTFIVCVGYMAYMNLQDSRKGNYTTLNEDGSLSSRPKVSKWEWQCLQTKALLFIHLYELRVNTNNNKT